MSKTVRKGEGLISHLDSGIFRLADHDRVLALLERIELILLAGGAGVAVAAYYLNWHTSLFIVSVALIGIFLGLTVARAGHARISAMLLLVTLYVMISLGIYLGDGLHDVIILLMPLVMLLGSFLLSRVAYVILSGLCTATVVGVGLLEWSGWRVYPLSPLALPGDMLMVLVLMVTVAVLVRTLAGVIYDSLQRVGQSERNYREIFDASSDAIFVHEPTSARVINANPAAAAMLGYSRDELLSLAVPDFSWDSKLFSEAAVTALFEQVVTEGPATVEWCGRKCDGSQIWVEVSLHQVVLDSQDRIVAVARDIDRRKRVEEQLRQGEKMQAVGLLAGGIAHDFNNQLAGIMGYADLIEDSLDPSQHDLRENVQGILLAAGRSAKLTAQLLAFARKAHHESRPVNLHDLVDDVISLLKRSIDKRIRIERRLEASHPVTLGDAALLQSALLNLAINARDAMPTGGSLTFSSEIVSMNGRDRVDHHVDALAPGRYVKLQIQDTGTGVDPEIQHRIFEPFFTTKPEGQGTGMGLSAVYGTVKNHGGGIELTSRVGEGALFTVYLPLHHGDVAANDERTPNGSGSAPARGVRVLIVDDEAVVCSMATRLVEQCGGTANVCRDGIEAVAYYEQAWSAIDAVLLDMVMPRMGGTETFHRLREINPSVRILLTSGYSVNDEVETLLKEGANGFLQKPFRKEDFIAKMGAAVPTSRSVAAAT